MSDNTPFAVGFTGTRKGMTKAQNETVAKYLHDYSIEHHGIRFIHGGAEGADEEADALAIASAQRLKRPPDIVIRPGSAERYQFWLNRIWLMKDDGTGRLLYPPHPPLERNHLIVDAAAVMLCTPKGASEERRSGTWATIRYARKVHVTRIVIWPDGSVTSNG